jgi:tetratricopeptide (TPR) repeat protein
MTPRPTATPASDTIGPRLADASGSAGERPARRRRPGRVACAVALVGAALAGAVAWAELHPPSLAKAEAAYAQNDLESALRLAEDALEGWPEHRGANALAGRCLSRLGKPLEAEPFYQKVSPLGLEDSHIRAYAFVINNLREQAILAYDELLSRWPDDVLALSRRAGVLISESRWNDAQETAGRLAGIPAGTVIGYTLAAVVHHNTGEAEEAVDEFGRVLELDPELKQMPLKPRSMFWAEFGKCLLTIGRAKDAERHLHRALREGDDPTVADLLGQAYYLQGSLDDADQCWKLALQWDPGRAGTWWRLGKLELQRGQASEAVESLRRSTELEPRASGPFYSLSLACRRLGRIDESERFRRQADDLRAGKSQPPRADMDDLLPGSEHVSHKNRSERSPRPGPRAGGLPETAL